MGKWFHTSWSIPEVLTELVDSHPRGTESGGGIEIPGRAFTEDSDLKAGFNHSIAHPRGSAGSRRGIGADGHAST